MAQHFANRLDGYAIRIGHCRGKCVAGEVRGHAFIDAENARNLFQVLVVLRIADNRQDIAARALLLVFAQYRQRNIEQFRKYTPILSVNFRDLWENGLHLLKSYIMQRLDHFLYAYFYQIETELNKDNKALSTIKFQSEEANTDEELKLFFKSYLSEHNKLSLDSSVNSITIKVGAEEHSAPIAELNDIYVKKVWLPQELTPEMKSEIAKSKTSVYTNPDLYLEILMPEGSVYVSIELKSTKNNKIPGSSVQQVSPYEWVIFIKHSAKEINTVCGLYVNSITKRLPFPDRSPRPEIGHNTLKKWNKKNRKVENSRLVYTIDTNEDNSKKAILEDWEQVLCNEWLETIDTPKREKEKWFNNTIRLFSYELLKSIKDNPENLDKLLKVLEKNITK